jgi:hypothetical protein
MPLHHALVGGPCRPGPPAAFVPTVLGQIYQVIDANAVRVRWLARAGLACCADTPCLHTPSTHTYTPACAHPRLHTRTPTPANASR